MSEAFEIPSNSNAQATEKFTQNTSPFAGLGNTELSVVRTDLAEVRTDLARERNRMAAERTLMAWIRTSLSMITFGFGIDRFFHYLKIVKTDASVDQLSEERVLGLSLITLGVFALAAAMVSHWRTLKKIEQHNFKYIPGWSLGITVAIVLVFIGLASYIPLLIQDVKIMDFINLDSQIIQNLASLTVFSIMLTLGVELPFKELLDFWQKPGLLARSLLAVIVIPAIVIALVLLVFNLPKTFAIALVLLIASPGPALLTKRAAMAGASFDYVLSLQVTLALLAVMVTPLILKLFSFLTPYTNENVNFLLVAKQITLVQFLPLSLGLAIRTIWSELAEEINNFLKAIANTLFIVLSIFALVVGLNLIPGLGIIPLLVAILITLLGLMIGHVLASGYEADIQSGLAVTTIARNVGLAIFIATKNGQAQLVPVIVALLIVGIVAGLPYSVWIKQKIAHSQATSIEASATS
ncbi:Na+-dependent transporter [Hapalosiphon sp. MRB220]|nr:Na+-dependent transporter [Hapalosiphon sp. MRB220]